MSRPTRIRMASLALSEMTANSSIYSTILPLPKGANIPSLVMREVGPCRSVFVLKPHLSTSDWTGLSERLSNWGHNESINSVLITSQDAEDIICDDGSILPLNAQYRMTESVAKSSDFIFNRYLSKSNDELQRHVMLGFDPLASDPSTHEDTLDAIGELAFAMTDTSRKTPIIVCPNGFVSDGGLVYLLGQYVLATPETSFRIDHPTRGLSFDPCGMSYVLPRLGLDFEQKIATKCASTIAKILALTGFEADGCDLVSSGLATHYVDSIHNIPLMEAALSEIPSYQDQGLLPSSTRSQAQWIEENNAYFETGKIKEDIQNNRFRNVAVHELMEDVSVAIAGKDDFLAGPLPPKIKGKNDSDRNAFDDEDFQLGGNMGSTLLDIAYAFHPIFEEEKSVHGMMERLREISNSSDNNVDVHAVEVASYLLKGMEKRSPLSLRATHKLLVLGEDAGTSMGECMERENTVQKNLLKHKDFQSWYKAMEKGNEHTSEVGWKHKSVKDVTFDEVEELFQEI